MAIYTRYGSKCEVRGPIQDDGLIHVRRISDGAEFNAPLLSLKADGGIQEIAAEAARHGDLQKRGVAL